MKDKIISLVNKGLNAQQIADDLECSLAFVIIIIKEINCD
jgi:orotate phosphoribosyltransferase-like protein